MEKKNGATLNFKEKKG